MNRSQSELIDPPAEILDTRSPNNWVAGDFADLSGITVDLAAQESALLRRVATLGKSAAELSREDIAEPALAQLAATIRQRIFKDRGFILLRGFPVADLSVAEAEATVFALACHLGHPVCQSAESDRIGHVTLHDDPELVKRGYRSNKRQRPHTDFVDLVGLFCLRPATRGGESQLVSGAAIHDRVARERPDLLPILYRGFHYDWRGEPPPGISTGYTDYRVPVFSQTEGRFAIQLNRFFFEAVPELMGTAFTPAEHEAIELVTEVSQRDDVRLTFPLAAGEAVIFDNTALLHSRLDYEDWPERERRRLLLRLWIETAPPVPVCAGMRCYIDDCKRAYGEFTSPQPPDLALLGS